MYLPKKTIILHKADYWSIFTFNKCGYNESNINKANPNDMEKYYSKEKQSQYGVVGIEISLIEN